MKNLFEMIPKLDMSAGWDRENQLLSIYIHLLQNADSYPDTAAKSAFMELSRWRDASLRDGCEAYYDECEPSCAEITANYLERAGYYELYRVYQGGFAEGSRDVTDEWIFDHKRLVNDVLSAIITEYGGSVTK